MPTFFPFMRLPKAIRLMVYERIPRETKHVRLHFPSFDEAILVCHYTHTAILATSRQVYSEAILYIRRTLQQFILERTPRLFVSDYKGNTILRTIMRATELQVIALDTGNIEYELPAFAQYPYFPESQIDEANFRKFIQISARQILPRIRENQRRQAQHLAQHAGNPNQPDLELSLPGYEVVFLKHHHGITANNDMSLAAAKISVMVTPPEAVEPPTFFISLAGAVPRLSMGKFWPANLPKMLRIGPSSQSRAAMSVVRHVTLLPEMSEEEWKENWLE